jgi:hypothetical protein
MRVLFHIFSLGTAQTPVALSAQLARKAPKNPAKREFLVIYSFLTLILEKKGKMHENVDISCCCHDVGTKKGAFVLALPSIFYD